MESINSFQNDNLYDSLSDKFNDNIDIRALDKASNNLNNVIDASYDMNSIIEYIVLFIILVIFIIVIYKYLFNNNNNNSEFSSNISTQNFINDNIISILEEVATKYPDLPALNVSKKSIKDSVWISVNYEDYFNNVKQFALSLNNWFNEGCGVAIIGSNCPVWFYSYLGCMANNGISVGICPSSSSQTCKQIINDSDVTVVIVEDDEQLSKLVDLNLKKVKLILYYSPV